MIVPMSVTYKVLIVYITLSPIQRTITVIEKKALKTFKGNHLFIGSAEFFRQMIRGFS